MTCTGQSTQRPQRQTASSPSSVGLNSNDWTAVDSQKAQPTVQYFSIKFHGEAWKHVTDMNATIDSDYAKANQRDL
jgi:hypothetical protein